MTYCVKKIQLGSVAKIVATGLTKAKALAECGRLNDRPHTKKPDEIGYCFHIHDEDKPTPPAR